MIEVYSKALCPFCARMKERLTNLGLDWEEYDVTMGGPLRIEMVQRSGGRATVPQLFINDEHIGGWDDFSKLSDETVHKLVTAG